MKVNRRNMFILGIGLLVAFALYSKAIKRGALKQTDFDTTVRLQDRLPKRFDGMWENAAFFVTPAVSVVAVGIVTIAALVTAKTGKKKLVSLLIPLLFGLMIVGEIYGKSVVHHPAPPFFMIKHPTTIFPQFYINEQFSYPSGHAARAVFLTLTLFAISCRLIKKRAYQVFLISCLLLYIVIIATGRIYLGHHWVSDIVGGWIVGGAFGFLSYALL